MNAGSDGFLWIAVAAFILVSAFLFRQAIRFWRNGG